jgi:hypothetical protein
MIQITLNFASIEAARHALLEIPASVLAAAPSIRTEVKPAPKAEPVKVVPPKETNAAPIITPSTALADTPAPEYQTLKTAVFTLAGKSREAVVAIAAEFGVKTFTELTEDKWADALVAVNAALAEAA